MINFYFSDYAYGEDSSTQNAVAQSRAKAFVDRIEHDCSSTDAGQATPKSGTVRLRIMLSNVYDVWTKLRSGLFPSSAAANTFLAAVTMDPRISLASSLAPVPTPPAIPLSIDLTYEWNRSFSTAPLEAIDTMLFRTEKGTSTHRFSMGDVACMLSANNRRLRALTRFLPTCRIRSFSLQVTRADFSADLLKSLVVKSSCVTGLYVLWWYPIDGVESIAEAAAMSPHLKALHITVGESGLEAFVQGLGRLPGSHLQSLSLRIDTGLQSFGSDSQDRLRLTAVAARIAQLLSSNHLITLNVDQGTAFDDISVGPIISALESNKTRSLQFLRLNCNLDSAIPRLARAVKGSRLRLLGMKSTDPSPGRLVDLISITAGAQEPQLDVLEVKLTEIAATSRQPSQTDSMEGLVTALRNSSLSILGAPLDLERICQANQTFLRAVTSHGSLRYPNFADGVHIPFPLAIRAARRRADILADVVLPSARILLIPATTSTHRTSQPPRRSTRWPPLLSRLVLDYTMSASFHPRDAAAVLATLSDRASIGFLDASAQSCSPCPCTVQPLCDCSTPGQHCFTVCNRTKSKANGWTPVRSCAVWERLFVWRCAAFVNREQG
ncbi:hypothetical protein DFJ73DRAFT_833187 [Zopfochytrium polystomum]|nr:hypothetical protein DFJ73DRAFT_833187 [Zopfochytrium polystomum]